MKTVLAVAVSLDLYPPQAIGLGGNGLRTSVSRLSSGQKVTVEEQAFRHPGAEDAKCSRGRPSSQAWGASYCLLVLEGDLELVWQKG